MAIIMIIMVSALGAALYRWRGGPTWLPAPRWLKLAACAAALDVGAIRHAIEAPSAWSACLALVGFLAAFWGLSRAHGSYYDLGNVGAGSESDWRWLERWLAGVRWLPLREGLLLAITGLAATLGPGLALVLAGGWSGWLLALSGALKAVAYAIGWRIAKGSRATVIGEWLTGAAMGLGVGIAVG